MDKKNLLCRLGNAMWKHRAIDFFKSIEKENIINNGQSTMYQSRIKKY